MVMKPDMFLLISVTSGVSIILVGLLVVLNCPFEALSCSWWCHKIAHVFQKINRRRKKGKINSSENVANGPGEPGKSFGVSLVEGRPQGHGFYSAGPWSSTDTTTTTFSTVDNLQQISLMTQMGLFGGEYYSAMMGATKPTIDNNENSASTTDANKPFSIYSGSSAEGSTLGIHGDNSNTLNLSANQISTCTSCNGAGFFPTENPALLPGQSGTTTQSNGHQPEESSHYNDVDEDDDMDCDCDADADMLMIF